MPLSTASRPSDSVPDTGPGGGRRYAGRILGLIPNSPKSRLFLLWAVLNFVLTFLPVWDVAFNDASLVGGFLPVTVLWSYLVFTSNLGLAIGLYVGWARDWAERVDRDGLTDRHDPFGEAPPEGVR